jgi:hypothetical protein
MFYCCVYIFFMKRESFRILGLFARNFVFNVFLFVRAFAAIL